VTETAIKVEKPSKGPESAKRCLLAVAAGVCPEKKITALFITFSRCQSLLPHLYKAHDRNGNKVMWIWIAGQFILLLCTRHERKQWHYSQCRAGNTRENDSAFHGHEELVSVWSLIDIMTFKGDIFLKIRVTLASEEVRWEKLTMTTDGGTNMFSSKHGVVERICEEIMQMSSEN